MATLEAAPRKIYQQRSRLTSLPLYYEGFLWIKRPRNKETKYWTELRGTKLFLYNDKKHEKYTDSIELWNLKSVTDRPSQKTGAEVTLSLEHEELNIRTEIPEDAEEWKGFILTVAKQCVPTWLTLLPGQIIRLKEVLEKEAGRMAEEASPVSPLQRLSISQSCPGPYDDVAEPGDMPLCFHNVSRQEAAEMLLKNDCGNLLLRPGADCKNYAVTIREPVEVSGRPQVKHYKILKTDRGYTIELEKPVTLNSLHDVVNHFVNETKGKLTPFEANIYDREIDSSLRETETSSPQSNVKKIVSQLSVGRHKPAQPAPRGKDQAYMNVFP